MSWSYNTYYNLIIYNVMFYRTYTACTDATQGDNTDCMETETVEAVD